MLGQHNVQNALAAIAVGVEMDVPEEHDPRRRWPASRA
jgi:UDP-N-acetylmuramyl pentapeptide synthase